MTTLNDAMEIDHPVWIEPDGTWDDDLDENPAGWVALRLRHADYPHWSGRLYDCAACELGPCTCNPSDAPCVSRHCATPEG